MCSFKKRLFVNPSDRPQAAPRGVMTSHRQFGGSRLPHTWPALFSCPWFSRPLPLPTPHIPKPHASPDDASVGAARAPSAERLSANLCVGAAGTAWVPGAQITEPRVCTELRKHTSPPRAGRTSPGGARSTHPISTPAWPRTLKSDPDRPLLVNARSTFVIQTPFSR